MSEVSDSVLAGWLAYGAALNEIKAEHPGNNNAFGAAVVAAGLDRWPEGSSHDGTTEIKRDIRSAAMWAASLPASELAAHQAAHHDIEVTVKGDSGRIFPPFGCS